MSKFGDLLGGKKAAPAPVPATAVEDLVETVAEEEVVELIPYESDVSINEMSKDELEEYGRIVGIELDKRHSRKKMVKELEEYLLTNS